MESGSLPEIEEINFTSSDNKSPIVNCDPPRGQQKWGVISCKQYPAAHRNLTSFCSSQTAMLSFLVPCESNLIVTTSLYNTLDTYTDVFKAMDNSAVSTFDQYIEKM